MGVRFPTSRLGHGETIHTSTRTGPSSREVSIRTLWSCFLETRRYPYVLEGKAIRGAGKARGSLRLMVDQQAHAKLPVRDTVGASHELHSEFLAEFHVSHSNRGIRHIAKIHEAQPKNTLLPTQQHLSEVILRLTLNSRFISRRCLGHCLRSCRCTGSRRWLSCPA